MPDISLCRNEECDRRESCYRFTAEPTDKYQSYAMFYVDGYGVCPFFIDNKKQAHYTPIT